MHDEDFDLSEDPSDLSFSTRKIQGKLYRDGYRIEKAIADEEEIQIGFDQGFKQGMEIGRACGAFYAKCRVFRESPHYDEVLPVIEDLLLRKVPDLQALDTEDLEALEECTLRLSVKLAADLEILRCFFREDKL